MSDDRIPRCKNGQPCPLPPPVRERLPQYTGCEGCQRRFILVTGWEWDRPGPEELWWMPEEKWRGYRKSITHYAEPADA